MSTTTPGSAAVARENAQTNMAFCIEEINRYRATVAQPLLIRSETLESYAAASAAVDAAAGVAHRHFVTDNGGGVARAETELLSWPNFDVRAVIEQGLAEMWRQGPAGEHYQILAGPWTEAGCGLAVTEHDVTIVQDFR